MSNFLPPEAVDEIAAGVRAGLSLRAIARMVGISTNTVRKYCPKQSERKQPCACGAPAGHRGWCTHRYAGSLARQAFHARRKGIVVEVPKPNKRSRIKEARARFDFVFGLAEDWEIRATALPEDQHYGVIGEVHSVTRRVTPAFRDDVRQAIILAVYEGRVARHEIDSVVGAFVKFEMRNTIGSMWSLYLSLNASYSSETGLDHLSRLSALDEDGVWRGSIDHE